MKKPIIHGRWVMIMLMGFLFVSSLEAQNEPGPITHTYALENVNIVTKPGQMISNGTVVVRNGLIHSVGKGIPIPSNAKILKADSMYVYAAFIDGASHVGTPKPKEEQQQGRRGGNNGVDPGNPTNARAGITPDLDVQSKLAFDDKSVKDLRKVGFGAVHTVPRGRMLPGSGAILILEGKNNDDIVLKSDVSAFAQLRGAGGVFPATVIAVISKFRDLYRQAEQAKSHIAKYNTNPNGIVRPAYDDAIMALIPVVSKTKPVYFMASDHLAIARVLQLQKELGFKLVLVGAKNGWHHMKTIQSKGIPMYLSMDLPKKEDDKKKKKKEEEKAEEMTMFDEERKAMQERKVMEAKKYVGQASMFSKAGIGFGFTTEGTNAKDIHSNIRRMIEEGLSEDAALSALTTYPAQQLGVSRMLGSVEKGKVANLMVTDKPYFEEKSMIAYMLVDGEVFEYKKEEKKKKGGPADATMATQLAGEWSYDLEVPGETQTGTLTFVNDDGELSGIMVSDQDDGGEETELNDISIDGQEVSFTIEINDGQITASFSITLDEGTFDGTVSVGDFGSFPVKGEKTPE
ncbi:MAG: amidohydrolase family protein [Maribacter sp.]|nr:amidohydrolase family protein [Maribacter sp.]